VGPVREDRLSDLDNRRLTWCGYLAAFSAWVRRSTIRKNDLSTAASYQRSLGDSTTVSLHKGVLFARQYYKRISAFAACVEPTRNGGSTIPEVVLELSG
jgi:hypothetical protein